MLRFGDGSIGVHSTIMTSKPRHDSAQVDGTEGRIFIDPLELDSDHITMETHEGRQVIPVQPLVQPLFDQPMIEDFARAVTEGRPPCCDAETGYRVQAVTDAATASATSGCRVTLDL